MLQSVLPALRTVRTPLIVGWLYMAWVWLMFGLDGLNFPIDDGSALSRRVEALVEWIGASGGLIVASVAATLIGSLLTFSRAPGWFRRARGQPVEVAYYSDLALGDWVENQLRPRTDPEVKLTFADLMVTEKRNLPAAFQSALVQVGGDSAKASQRLHLHEMAMATVSCILGELDVIETRLRIADKQMFDEVDRLRSEAELRYSIFVPLAGILLTLAWLWSGWVLVGLVIPAALVWDGYRAERRADRHLITALIHDVVKSPTVKPVQDAIGRVSSLRRSELQSQKSDD